MFFQKKKIRELNDALDTRKGKPEELQKVLQAIDLNSPEAPNKAFQARLREKLLLQHQGMVHATQPEKKAKRAYKERLAWKFKPASFAFALILLLFISGIASYPLIPAPQVDGYELKNSLRKVSYNAPIQISFSQPMDRASVEKAFQIEPKIDGTFGWNNNVLLFTPAQPFEIGDNYKVKIDSSAKSLFQKNLPTQYEENYAITIAPKVVVTTPAADFENTVDVTQAITVAFDRPMTSLKSLDEAKPLDGMKIEPSAPGRYKWLGTNTISFIPDKFTYGTSYVLTVPKGTKSADGGATEEDFILRFNTLAPAVLSTVPPDADSNIGPNTKVHLNFNQPMNLAMVQEKVELLIVKADGTFEKVDYTPAYYTKDEWIADQKALYTTYDPYFRVENLEAPTEADLEKTLILAPKNPLQFKSNYRVIVHQGFMGREGTKPLDTDYQLNFSTVGDLVIQDTNPEQGFDLSVCETNPPATYPPAGCDSQETVNNYVGIVFSQPIDLESLKTRIEILPAHQEIDGKSDVKPNIVPGEAPSSVLVYFPFQPATDYTFTIKSGVKDQFGQLLANDFVLKFRTGHLPKDFSLLNNGDLAILDANKPPVYYIKSSNLERVTVDLKPLSQQEFESIYSYGYVNSGAMEKITGPFTTWTQEIEKKTDQVVHTQLDLAKGTGRTLDPGFYYFQIRNMEKPDKVTRQIFVQAKTALTLKNSQDEVLVWATDLGDGSPRSGLNLQVFDRGRLVGEMITDKDGVGTLSLPKPESGNDYFGQEYTVMVNAEKNPGDFTFVNSSWSEGVAPWNFNMSYTPVESNYFIYSYTDRPIYRPGHTVYFKGIVRKDNDAKLSLPKIKKVLVNINDSQGESVSSQVLDLRTNGTFSGSFDIGEQAKIGTYSIQTELMDVPASEYASYQTSSFRVTEYRKPDYELNIKADKENYVNGETANINIQGGYFFGAPLQNAKYQWSLRAQDYYFFLNPDSDSPYANDWYSFSDDGNYCMYGCEGNATFVTSGKGVLNEKGESLLQLPFDLKDKKMSQFYTLEATVFDANNQSVSDRVTIPVHTGEYYLGIANDDYVVQTGEPMNFKVISVGFDGKPLKGKAFETTLYERKWNTVQKKNVDGGFYYENSYEDIEVQKKDSQTGEDGFTLVNFIAPKGGNYKVKVSAKDSKNNIISASSTMYVTSDEYIQWGRENNDKIELVADKQEYKVGDTAHILVKSPYKNVWALVTQERRGILMRKVVKIDDNSTTLDVEISERTVPNVFVSVVLMKGSKTDASLVEPPLGSADERATAGFKVGYTTLQVNTKQKQLDIGITTDREQYKPSDAVNLKFKVKDAAGNAQKADLSVAVVDKSVLSLTESVTADLLNEFYRKRSLGVASAYTLTKAIARVNVLVEAGLKGGGGGGGGVQKRGIFKDTAFWQANVETDVNGEASVNFQLPDNLTTWQVFVIGITDDTLVGSGKKEFLVNKDVLVRPVLPRFLITGDKLMMGAIVHNYSNDNLDLRVSIEASQLKVEGDTTRTIRLGKGEQQKVEWPVEVLSAEEATITLKALSSQNENIGDILEQKLPIKPYSFPEVVATSLTISDGDTHVENVWLPLGIDPNYGELTLSMAPTLANSISEGFQYLIRFPYGCSEQTASALLPNVLVKQFMKIQVFQNMGVDEKTIDKNVETGLQNLYKYQQLSGGWGVWETSQPSAYLTAYVLNTLHETEKAGYKIDEKVLNNGLAFLSQQLNNATNTPDSNNIVITTLGYNNYSPLGPNEKAYVLNVLSEMGKGDLGLTNNLYDTRSRLNLTGKIYLAFTYDNLKKTAGNSSENGVQAKLDTLMKEILIFAKETPRGLQFAEDEKDYRLFDTDNRTTALAFQLLQRVEPDHIFIPKILRYLLMSKVEGRYVSTQETAVVLRSLIEYLVSSHELEPSFEGTIQVNGATKIQKSYTNKNLQDQDKVTISLQELLPDNQNNEITVQRNGEGKLYFDVQLKYYLPTEKIQARDEGLQVYQQYFRPEDVKMEHPVTDVRLGENLRSHITLVVPQDSHYVMLEDYLPAGLEGIDFSLKTSQQDLQNMETQGKGPAVYSDQNWYFHHNEIRDDRVMYFADSLPKGVYEIDYFVRATAPGVFHDLPVLGQETYFPEVFGRSEGRILTVQDLAAGSS